MASVAVRVPQETFEVIRRVAEERQQTLGAVVADVMAEFEEKAFWDRFRAQVAETKKDPVAWQEIQEEQRVYDSALLDGLEPEP
jgi:hypothetical protein